MLNFNKAANEVNSIFLNYRYLLCKQVCINFLISNWAQLEKNSSTFVCIKYKWFKILFYNILSKNFVNRISSLQSSKFELKASELFIAKIQLIENIFINSLHLFFNGIKKKSKWKKCYIKHWILKPGYKFSLSVKKLHFFKVKKVKTFYTFLHFKTKNFIYRTLFDRFKKKVLKNLCSLDMFALVKILFNSSFWTKKLTENYVIFSSSNLFNIFIINYFLIFVDNLVTDFWVTNSQIDHFRSWNKYLVKFKKKLVGVSMCKLLTNFVRYHLFFNLTESKKLKKVGKSLCFSNYCFSIGNVWKKAKSLTHKIQSKKKYKYRSLVQLEQKNKRFMKNFYYKMQNRIKSLSPGKLPSYYKDSFLIKSNFTSYFNKLANLNFEKKRKQAFFIKMFDNKQNLSASFKKSLFFSSFKLKKHSTVSSKLINFSTYFGFYASVPVKNISQNLRSIGFLSYKKYLPCVNNVVFFDNYFSVIQLYSIVILKLLLYYKIARNFSFLKTLCVSVRKSCLLTLKSKYSNTFCYSQVFYSYYLFTKRKFTRALSKFFSKNIIFNYTYSFRSNYLFLSFNILYLVWKFKSKNYFYVAS